MCGIFCEIKSISWLNFNFWNIVIWFLRANKRLQIVLFMFSETTSQLEVWKGVFKLLLVCLNWKLATPVADVFLLYSCFLLVFRNPTRCFRLPVFIYVYCTYQKWMKVCLHLKGQNIVCVRICIYICNFF